MLNKKEKIHSFIRQYPIPIFFGLSLIIAVLLFLTKASPRAADTSEKPRPVDTIPAALSALSPSIPVFVKVTSPHHAQLRSSVTADVAALKALEGARVNVNDVIISLDNKETRLIVEQRHADVMEANARIAAEKLNHENELFVLGDIKKLSANGKRNRDNIIKEHKIKLSQLAAQLLRAEAALKLAELDLARTEIKSPFDGRVTRLHVSVGDRVRPGDLLAEVYDYAAIELRGPVTTRYLGAIQDALDQRLIMEANFHVDGKTITAYLDRLSGEINSKSGSVDAIFKLDLKDDRLQLGRNFKLHLLLSPVENSFVVPLSALYGVDTIYKVVEQRLKAVKVTRLGDYQRQDAQQSQILLRSEEIKPGDLILVTQLPYAVENLLVKPAAN